jgi:hypothetical protein
LNSARKITSPFNLLNGLELDFFALKPSIICFAKQGTLKPWRRDFERVAARNKVLNLKQDSSPSTNVRTIRNGHSSGPVYVEPQHRISARLRHFHAHQLEAFLFNRLSQQSLDTARYIQHFFARK